VARSSVKLSMIRSKSSGGSAGPFSMPDSPGEHRENAELVKLSDQKPI
jgi:hypothetical protein